MHEVEDSFPTATISVMFSHGGPSGDESSSLIAKMAGCGANLRRGAIAGY